ncbi:ABC transporter permease [Rubeoparvulum massiliense]|uniref:ABC transporter permease n=1 Tax=Rubeoparvulum massiliense TaxID=1631346 RepID=UPI00065E6870|nr:ABC transporter permease [Rubeoparvulum massiliense]
MRRLKNGVKQGWRPILVLILFFSLWEIVVRIAEIPAWLLPAPTVIWQAAVEAGPRLAQHVVATIQLTLLGFLIGTVTGLSIAMLLHRFQGLRQAFYPLLILTQNVPIIVLAPLLVIWFGFGILPKLIVITLVVFFPVAVAALDGFRQVPLELTHYLEMAGASRNQQFWKLELPYALPSIFSGLKISATYSVMGAVISEWLGAKAGIGVFMTLASSSFRTDRVFAAIMIIMALSLIFFVLIQLLERFLIRWKPEKGR